MTYCFCVVLLDLLHTKKRKKDETFLVTISGNLEDIPTKIPRKMAQPRKQKKEHLITGFKVVDKGEGDYYGFTVDKNHKFLLGDFTVTHNTCTSILVGEAYKAYKYNKILYETEKDASNKDIIVNDSRIIVSLPAAIQEQFKEELVGKIKKNELTGCVSNIEYNGENIEYQQVQENQDIYFSDSDSGSNSGSDSGSNSGSDRGSNSDEYNENENAPIVANKAIVEDKNKINEEIGKYWNITTHQKFINGLFHHSDINTLMPLIKQLQRGGNIIIIDEIQNLISESGILYKKIHRYSQIIL